MSSESPGGRECLELTAYLFTSFKLDYLGEVELLYNVTLLATFLKVTRGYYYI